MYAASIQKKYAMSIQRYRTLKRTVFHRGKIIGFYGVNHRFLRGTTYPPISRHFEKKIFTGLAFKASSFCVY